MKIPKRQKQYMLMVHHDSTLLSALKWWAFKRNKQCKSFCPLCEYYYRCQEDVALNKLLEGK